MYLLSHPTVFPNDDYERSIIIFARAAEVFGQPLQRVH